VPRVLALIVAFACVVAGGVSAAIADTQRASLSQFVCRQSQDPLNRVIAVTATMRPVPGTARMELRFVLLQRLPGNWLHRVHGGDLGRWKALAVGPWAVTKPVVNLPAPAVYRFRVSFRWLGASGRVIGAQTLLGPACDQAGQPPAAG
jgi:hypothetical protein